MRRLHSHKHTRWRQTNKQTTNSIFYRTKEIPHDCNVDRNHVNIISILIYTNFATNNILTP